MASAGVAPRVMGNCPVPSVQKLLRQTGLALHHMDVIELNEAFAALGLAVLRQLGPDDDDPRVNPKGGVIALGRPLGMSGARLVTTAMAQLHHTGGRYALCTMCIRPETVPCMPPFPVVFIQRDNSEVKIKRFVERGRRAAGSMHSPDAIPSFRFSPQKDPA
jgi:hypothetical protein